MILKNGNTMIELDGLGSATERFSDETIMSPYPESNFPRVSISNEVSNYKVQPQNRSLKMCDKLEDNTEYLEKSAAFIGKTFHKFLEEAVKCWKQKQIRETKPREIAVEKSTKIEKPHVQTLLMKSPMFHKMTLGNFNNNLATPVQILFLTASRQNWNQEC